MNSFYIILCGTKDKLVQANKNLHTDNGKQAMEELLAALKEQYPTEQFVVDSYECRRDNAEPVEDGKEQTHLETHYKMRMNGVSDEKAPREFSYRFLKTWKRASESKAA